MKIENRKKFLEIVIGFAELKGKALSAPALELYWNAMQSWSIEDFQEAANHLIMTCEFMPTPKDFAGLRKAGRDTAGEAWAAILTCARRGIERPEIGESALRALNAIGGIRAVMMSNPDSTHFLERRFGEHFEQIQDADDVREAVPMIANRKALSGPQSIQNLLEDFTRE